MTDKKAKKSNKKTTVIPRNKKPRPVPATGGGQGGFLTGMGGAIGVG